MVVLSVVPVGVEHLVGSRELAWRLGSIVAVAYFAIGTPLFRRYAASIRSEFEASGVTDDDRLVFWGGVAFALVSVENAIGWPIVPNFGSYMVALLLAFLISAYTFATIVTRRPGGGRGA